MYERNIRCSVCERYMNPDGTKLQNGIWRCKCCSTIIRKCPIVGRKALNERIKTHNRMPILIQ